MAGVSGAVDGARHREAVQVGVASAVVAEAGFQGVEEEAVEEVQVAAGKEKYSAILHAISDVEIASRTEIRVHIGRKLMEVSPSRSACRLFHRLEMHRTREDTGILVYLNLSRRKFALYGGSGIHKRWASGKWTEYASKLSQAIREKGVDHGVAQVIREMGKELAEILPPLPEEKNLDELPNAVDEE